MPNSLFAQTSPIRPWRLFGLVLTTVFAVEALVMIALPRLIPNVQGFAGAAVWDACLLTLTLAPLLWILVVRPLHRLAEGRQRLLAFALSAQETERGRIARDLHDGVGQGLTCLLVGLRAIEEMSNEPEVQGQARELRRLGGDAHEEIRRLARGLRPAALDEVGLVPALERLVEDVRSIQDLNAELHVAMPAEMRMPQAAETALYRIAQEALNNALRHAAAGKIRVDLRGEPGRVWLQVTDDGSGFDPHAAEASGDGELCFGLSSIRERAWLAGGTATIRSTPGAGSQLTVEIPLEPGGGQNGKNAHPDR